MLHASSLLWSDVGLDGIVRGGCCMVCGTTLLATSRGRRRTRTHRKSKPRREDRGPGSSRRAGGHGGVDSSAGPVQARSPDGARGDGSVTPVPDRAGGGHRATRRTVESIAIASIQTSAGVPRPGPPAVHSSDIRPLSPRPSPQSYNASPENPIDKPALPSARTLLFSASRPPADPSSPASDSVHRLMIRPGVSTCEPHPRPSALAFRQQMASVSRANPLHPPPLAPTCPRRLPCLKRPCQIRPPRA